MQHPPIQGDGRPFSIGKFRLMWHTQEKTTSIIIYPHVPHRTPQISPGIENQIAPQTIPLQLNL
jgi:hypothetical protein